MIKNQMMEFDALQAVATLNTAAGKVPLAHNDPDYWDKVKSQADLIQSEVDEIYEAIEDKNLSLLRDATCDAEVTTLGMFHIGSIDYNKDMDITLKALLTRFCTAANVKATEQKYNHLGVETYTVHDKSMNVYIVLSTKDQHDIHGTFYPKDKWLKSIDHQEPVFD